MNTALNKPRRKAKVPRTSFTPEWVGLRGTQRIFDIGESSIYALIKAGKIQSKLLVHDGCTRGKRLVNVASLRAFLNSAE